MADVLLEPLPLTGYSEINRTSKLKNYVNTATVLMVEFVYKKMVLYPNDASFGSWMKERGIFMCSAST